MKKRIYMSVIAGKKKDMKCPQDFKRHGHYGLQLFAEDPEGGDPEGSGNGGEGEKPEGSGGGKESKDRDKDGKGSGERTYNDAEVDRIVAKHKKEWEAQHAKDLEKAKDEARKYERMSKEQREEADRKKAEEEVAKKDARIAELEQQIATDALRKSVAADIEAMPEGITVTQDFLDLVVTGEGRMDWQSSYGKVPSGVGKRCQKAGVPAAERGKRGKAPSAMHDRQKNDSGETPERRARCGYRVKREKRAARNNLH